MAVDGKLGSVSRNDERARGNGHAPVIRTAVLAEDNGEYPVGMLLAENDSGEGIPYEVVTEEAVGTGDGAETDFSGSLASAPVQPGTVTVSDGVETFTDDGMGNLTGDAGGTGSVNYKTGAVSVSFNAAPANEAAVEAGYGRKLKGVLDEDVDTAKSTAGLYVAHGSVRTDILKIGIAGDDPTTAQLAMLESMGIWPE
ncbi:MAG: hypothetical protein SWH61_05340 [Thermodesulfobacteriota bacterium]|nr:hypothetical protein [Thermodesulfobacteriota bacterium]